MDYRKRGSLLGGALAALFLVLVFAGDRLGSFEDLDGWFYNHFSRHLEEHKPENKIVLIEIGDEDLKILGKWAWPREYHAALLSILEVYSPRVVGFDILFVEEDSKLAELKSGSVSASDAKFAEALARARKKFPVILPGSFESEKSGLIFSRDHKGIRQLDTPIRPPLEIFRGSSVVISFVDTFLDPDKTLRRIPLFLAAHGQRYPAFPLTLALGYWGMDPLRNIEVSQNRMRLTRSGGKYQDWPLNNGDALVRYGNTDDHFYRLHYAELLLAYEGKSSLDLNHVLKDKVVIIGGTAQGFNDQKKVPFANEMYGMETQGMFVSNMLDPKKGFIRPVEASVKYAGYVLFQICVLLAFLRVRHLASVLLFIVICLGTYAGTYLMMTQADVWMSPGIFLTGYACAYIFPLGVRYFYEEKEKRWIRHAFGHYLSPNVMEEVLAHPDRLKLGGEKRKITVLFSDIRGFTGYCEKHSALEVVALLNEFMDRMTDIILRNNGTLDKFIGDAIMALFGTPALLSDRDNAFYAVKTAWEMREELKRMQTKWVREGKSPIGIGIGINTGEMIAGNMGSSKVMSYTVIGDEVNLGARVEGLTRSYGCDIIMTESTYAFVSDIVEAHYLDEVQVKGRSQKVKIYALDDLTKAGQSPNAVAI